MSDDILEELEGENPVTAELRKKLAASERKNATVKQLEKEIKDTQETVLRLERELGILERIGHRNEPPKWLEAPKKSGSKHNGIPWLMLSDLHLDEVVNPEEISGVNAYNRNIALSRLNKTAENFVRITRDYWTGINYDGAVVALGGDLFSGNIHEELKETNEDTMLASLDFWIDPLADCLRMISEEYGKLHVPVVVGNHGRMTRKPRAKQRARDNFDWFIGRALQRIFKDDPKITFDVSDNADCQIPCYDRSVMLTHGDQARGGGGIGGIWPPIMRLDARKRARYDAVDQGYELLVIGHWHQLVYGPNFIVNGSLKGYDEYAHLNSFGFEPPQQAAWLMTPEYGKTWTAPVFSQDRKAEGW